MSTGFAATNMSTRGTAKPRVTPPGFSEFPVPLNIVEVRSLFQERKGTAGTTAAPPWSYQSANGTLPNSIGIHFLGRTNCGEYRTFVFNLLRRVSGLLNQLN